jgi:hypothetical protein
MHAPTLETGPIIDAALGICVPEEVILKLEKEVGIVRNAIVASLPVVLSRGVPPMMNINLVNLARKIFDDLPDYEKIKFYTYTGEKLTGSSDKNSFRGYGPYITHCLKNLREKWGLNFEDDQQIITGTSGGQDLVTSILKNHIGEGRPHVITAGRTFDRTRKVIDKVLSKREETIKQCGFELPENATSMTGITETAEGLDLAELQFELEQNGPQSVIFIVSHGSNPSGVTTPIDKLVKICELAQAHESKVVMDAAYIELFFDGKNKESLKPLQEYIDNGTASITFTSTKEGGGRGTAHSVGSQALITQILEEKSNERLSVDYQRQWEQMKAEKLTARELRETYGKGNEIETFEEYQQKTLRRFLKASFEAVKGTLTKLDVLGVGKLKLSNPDVTSGYNVSVLFPRDWRQDKEDEFFRLLKKYGIDSSNLESFTVGEKQHDFRSFSAGRPQRGFRIPSGSFTPAKCEVFSGLIAAAFEKVNGGN